MPMKNGAYYHIYTASDTPCHLTKEAIADAQRTWLCSGCGSPKPGIAAIDARLQDAPEGESLNIVFGAGLGIAERKLLEGIGSELVRHELYLGRVYGPNGRELKDWATFRGKHRLVVRGTKNTQRRRCPDCGQLLYFAMGKSYLYPAPESGVFLFESNDWGLILTEDVFMKGDLGQCRGVYIDKLSVADMPKDSFGDLVL